MSTSIELLVIFRKKILKNLSISLPSCRYPCNSTSMCRNWPSGPTLQCLTPVGGGSVQQCLCNSTQYFDYCQDRCYTVKNWQQPCNVSTCYAPHMCDQTRGLSCINNICNCTNFEWWNSTRCVPKGKNPLNEISKTNLFDLATNLGSCQTGEHYQCEEYNFLSCIASQCQCGSTMYWSSASNTCILKRSHMGTCASTNECLTSTQIGLSCVSGLCQCTGGQVWNSTTQQCN